MYIYTHEVRPALDAHPALKEAYGRRWREATQAVIAWNKDEARPDFAAIRRSIESDHGLNPAAAVAAHLSKNTSDVAILGIGGSSLGAQALGQLAYWGTPAYAPAEGKPRVHIIENLDGATFATFLKRVDLKTTRFFVVSKSGSTTEPLMQTLAAIEALEAAGGGKYLKHHFAGEVGLGDNPLRAILTDMGAPILDHDPDLGGRYSVFATGLVPAMLFGLDVEAMRKGAWEVFITVFMARAGIPPAVEGAALNAAARDVGLTQAVLWPYTDRLDRLAMWYRQLWAESLGKGGQGTTPIRALGPVDQHSQLQLYLDGPNDKLFTLIDAPPSIDAKANAAWATKHGLALYADRGMNEVVAAQTKAVAETLGHKGRPARRITLEEPLNERGLGALLMHFMWETLLTARLWNVDPFGQPAVEDAKVLTRRFLSGQS